jgi:hypothetical protein
MEELPQLELVVIENKTIKDRVNELYEGLQKMEKYFDEKAKRNTTKKRKLI